MFSVLRTSVFSFRISVFIYRTSGLAKDKFFFSLRTSVFVIAQMFLVIGQVFFS